MQSADLRRTAELLQVQVLVRINAGFPRQTEPEKKKLQLNFGLCSKRPQTDDIIPRGVRTDRIPALQKIIGKCDCVERAAPEVSLIETSRDAKISQTSTLSWREVTLAHRFPGVSWSASGLS